MTKAARITVRVVFAFIALFGLLITAFVLIATFFSYGDENYSFGRTASDFLTLEMAVKNRIEDGKFTLDDLEQLRSIDDFAAVVAPVLDDPSIARMDGRNQPLLFDRQEQEDRTVLTVRSTIEYRRGFWELLEKKRPLAMEIMVFREGEKRLQVKQLWRSH